MAKAHIIVENMTEGFEITVGLDNAYPKISIIYNQKEKEVTYSVFSSDEKSISSTSYTDVYAAVDSVAKDLLQVAYLVYKQKTVQYQSEREQLIEELLSM